MNQDFILEEICQKCPYKDPKLINVERKVAEELADTIAKNEGATLDEVLECHREVVGNNLKKLEEQANG